MSTFFLYYFLIVVSLMALAAASCACTFLFVRRLVYFWSACLFLVYIFDVSLVFRRDFSFERRVGIAIYEVTSEVESVLLGALLILFLWLGMVDYFNLNRSEAVAPVLVFVAGSFIILQQLEKGAIGEFLFYSMRGVLSLWILARIAYLHLKTPDDYVRSLRRRHLPVVAMTLAWVLLAFLENAIFMLLPFFSQENPPPFLPEHNPMENFLFVTLALYALVQCWRALRVYSSGTPDAFHQPVLDYREATEKTWVRRYSLSAREAEIFSYLLEGKSNREIAEELVLSVNTVKVHVRNILRKCGTANRKELTERFWHAD